jgi:hypothetical protein
MDSGSRKPLNRRGLIELIVAAVLIGTVPILVATQSGQAGEPWNDIWLGDWPALMDTGPDPRSAALHERAAASLERVTNGGGDVKLAGDL